MRQPLSWQRGGALALLVLIAVAAAALVLDADAGSEYAPIVERLESEGVAPAELVLAQGRAAPIVVVGDVPGRARPKRMVAEAIRGLADGPGLDAVVLEVPSSEQGYIDAYLAGETDATTLLGRPAAVQERHGLPREYLAVYEAVRSVNEGRSAARRVRVIAADVESWPPPQGVGPRAVGEAFARRAEHMLTRIDRELFSIMPEARVLVFVDGYLALQGTHGQLDFGGGDPVRVEWLGELLRKRSGAGARTVLLDAGSSTNGVRRLPTYHGTALHRPLSRELDRAVGAQADGALGAVRDPVLGVSTPGLTLEILPAGYTLERATQAYIFLPEGR
ncbi:MAG: hypothetical protein ACOCVZ_09660 [Gemmatimonadota bacterium]